MNKRFRKDQRIWVNISWQRKLIATVDWWVHTGKWMWGPPAMCYILGYREDMEAWEVMDITGKTWFVIDKLLTPLERE